MNISYKKKKKKQIHILWKNGKQKKCKYRENGTRNQLMFMLDEF